MGNIVFRFTKSITMKLFHFVKFVLPSLLCLPACGQVEQSIGGPCEGCEAIYESSIAFEKLLMKAALHLKNYLQPIPCRVSMLMESKFLSQENC